MTPLRAVAAFVLASALAVACSPVRYAAYPPEFTWLSDEKVEGPMRALARDVADLEATLRRRPQPDDAARARVLALLGRMEASVASLEGPAVPVNHPLLAQRLPQFRAALVEARTAVNAEPPSYFLAGRVSGACLACHTAR